MRQPGGSESGTIVPDSAEDVSVSVGSGFEPFYEANRDAIGRGLALMLDDAALGFEAADEAMARAYERWDMIRDGSNPSGWVYRTGLNWARSWLRRRRRSKDKAPLLARADAVDERPVDTDLAEALKTLSDDHRAVVVLRYFNDWSVEQTAEALEIAPGTVKSRLSRALDELNRQLEGRPEGGSAR
ncbi:MAG: sigma-70 family RNA polymerase sigma factor [Acidimicrobiales bacterium]|nr:sigma-70 family RNA polymerase sigma factor [Acidimicrobiales bacterium]